MVVASRAESQPVHGLRPGGAMRDDLGQHRVVAIGDLVALLDPRIHPHARRPVQHRDASSGRQKARLGILRVDPRLYRMPHEGRSVRQADLAQGCAGRDAQLIGDEVASGDGLGHRVLDLEPSIHLEEVELSGVGHEHLDRSGADISDSSGYRERGPAHSAAKVVGHARRG